jgi:hypothetical protein
MIMNNPKKLHLEFVRLGSMRLKLKNKMLLILPEIYKSGIWKNYAGSIVEYAGKYGDIAKSTVIKRLRLEENLEEKPYLKAAIGEVGVHKVAMVAKIATTESDFALADKVLNMSKMAVQSLSKELKTISPQAEEPQPVSCKATPRTAKIELDEEATFLLMKLKTKLGKHMSDKDFLKMILEERIANEFPKRRPPKKSQKSVTGDTSRKTTRYIPAATKYQAINKTQGRCSYPGCNSPFQVFHHTDRYSISKNHNSIIPLCKIHHEFAHNSLIQNEAGNVSRWQMAVVGQVSSPVDTLYRNYRQGHCKQATFLL